MLSYRYSEIEPVLAPVELAFFGDSCLVSTNESFWGTMIARAGVGAQEMTEETFCFWLFRFGLAREPLSSG